MEYILDEERIYTDWWAGLSILKLATKYDVTTSEIEAIINKFQIDLFNQEEEK